VARAAESGTLPENAAHAPSLRRAGVIGDIHCEDEVLENVLRHFSSRDVDTLLAVGDIVDGVGDPNRVCSLLAQHNVFAVAGNHDRWLLEGSMRREIRDATPASSLVPESRRWLEQLPKTRSFQTLRGPLLLCHGIGENDMSVVRPDDTGYALESNLALQGLLSSKQYRFVLGGHSHLPMVRTIGGLTIITAGTLDRLSRQVCCILDFEKGKAEFFNASKTKISNAECFTLA
jgi:predicted phosphodiesterase